MLQGLCNGAASVHSSVYPSYQLLLQHAAGLLRCVWRAEAAWRNSSKGEQYHVSSRDRTLNTDLLVKHRAQSK